MSEFDSIFSPGLAQWKEYKDQLRTKKAEAPAPGPGPSDCVVDLDARTIIMPPESDDEVPTAP
ncbi:MAG: hypothetical protein FWG15_04110 [Propionibacteriaceae bacterium]|nr:hypothetical protein [Propionibacteriaceae bacterium]